MPWPPTTDDLLDFNEAGVFHRADTFEFVLLDRNDERIGEVHPRADQPPTITIDTDRAMIRSLDGLELPASEQQDINPQSDRLQPVMVLQNGERRPWGVYLFASRSRPRRSWGNEQVVNLRDKLHILASPRGRTSSTNRGQNLLQRAIDHLRLRIPDTDIVVQGASNAVASAPMLWQADVNLQDVVNDHLEPAGFYPVHFNHDGKAVLRQRPSDPETAEPDLIYRPAGRIIADSIVQTDDDLDAPNVFVVVDTSGNNQAIVGRYVIPSSAPHSIANRGYEVVHVEQVQGVESRAQADQLAKAMGQTASRGYEFQEFAGTLDPRHQTFDLVQLLGTNFLERSQRIPLASGAKHEHVLRRVY